MMIMRLPVLAPNRFGAKGLAADELVSFSNGLSYKKFDQRLPVTLRSAADSGNHGRLRRAAAGLLRRSPSRRQTARVWLRPQANWWPGPPVTTGDGGTIPGMKLKGAANLAREPGLAPK